ncbi:MAG: class I SAM-dependent methyltransferase [Promethearchaeota archaeon]
MENYYYNKIAEDYDQKRKKPWRPFEKFLMKLKNDGLKIKGFCLDLGCANGRHFKTLKTKEIKLIGIDNAIEFLKIAKSDLSDVNKYQKEESKGIALILADINFLPIRKKKIDVLISIATIHHIKEKINRKKVITQINEILKDNGFILITVWRRWQKKLKSHFIKDFLKRLLNPKFKKEQINMGLVEFGDKFVPWTVIGKNETYNRFYHFFSKHEIKKLIEKFYIKDFIAIGGPNKRDNFFIHAKKKRIN